MNPLNHMGPPAAHAIFLSQVTNIEKKIQIIQDLKNGAPGYDEISASALKLVSRHVVFPLVYLCNLSIEQGVFPGNWSLQMFSHYTKLMILSYSITIDLYLC